MVSILITIRNRIVCSGLPGVTWFVPGGFKIANGTLKTGLG